MIKPNSRHLVRDLDWQGLIGVFPLRGASVQQCPLSGATRAKLGPWCAVPMRPIGNGCETRLRALATDPHAFLETLEDARTLPDVHWRERATPSETQATFVEEREGSFAAMVAVFVADDPATAYLVGMWVAPELRGTGVAIHSSSTCSTGRAAIGACGSCSPWSRGTTVQRGCTRTAGSSRSRNRRSSRTSPTLRKPRCQRKEPKAGH